MWPLNYTKKNSRPSFTTLFRPTMLEAPIGNVGVPISAIKAPTIVAKGPFNVVRTPLLLPNFKQCWNISKTP
jgi:hypothetical protein